MHLHRVVVPRRQKRVGGGRDDRQHSRLWVIQRVEEMLLQGLVHARGQITFLVLLPRNPRDAPLRTRRVEQISTAFTTDGRRTASLAQLAQERGALIGCMHNHFSAVGYTNKKSP